MTTKRTGRAASLPPTGYSPLPRRAEQSSLTVRYVPENPDDPPREFDFSTWTVSLHLKEAFAAAFTERTRTGSSIRSADSADRVYRHLRYFSVYLAGLVSPPTAPSELTRAHLEGWYLPRQTDSGGPIVLADLKRTLRKAGGLSTNFLDALNEPNPPRTRSPKASYSYAENQRILRAARSDARAAADRINANRNLLARWRSRELDAEPEAVKKIGELLDYIDTHHDVPRYESTGTLPKQWVSRLGTVSEHLARLHLTCMEAAAFAVLLVGLTGQNPSTIAKAPASHHRTDGEAGDVQVAVVSLDKPRRQSRRHMNVPLTAVPPWARRGIPDDGVATAPSSLDLNSPFGVYRLLIDLATPARSAADTNRLFVWWAGNGGRGTGRGFHTKLYSDLVRSWSLGHEIRADADGETLTVTLDRMRLTFNELQQRPVAHTEATLVNEYLARNRGNLAEYQKIVAETLSEQVTKAQTRGTMQTLSVEDIAEAHRNPRAVALRHGMDGATLRRLLGGELDTVLSACVDHTNSPHSPAGEPCRASFMLCLSCPCARSTPAHLPIQIAVHDEMLRRRDTVTPLRWAQRFAAVHSQLSDLLERSGDAATDDARASITPIQRQIAERFLDRELDIA